MRIGLDATALFPGDGGGIETYARELIVELTSVATAHEFVVFGQPTFLDSLVGPAIKIASRTPAQTQTEAFLQQLTWLPTAANEAHVDLLHHLKNYACARLRVPQILTLHDVGPEYFLRHDPTHAGLRDIIRTALMIGSARLVDHVVTVSDAAASEIVRVTGIARRQITVSPIAPKRLAPAMAPRDTAAAGYFLTIAKPLANKNLARLARAFMRSATRRQLIICGFRHSRDDSTAAEVRQLATDSGGRIQLIGFVTDERLGALYDGARAVVCPSMVEGFGLVPVEAAARGVAVAVSDIPAHREVMAEAALIFDPRDEGAIREALDRLDTDEELCAELAAAALQRARQFSWRRTATITAAVYDSLLRPSC